MAAVETAIVTNVVKELRPNPMIVGKLLKSVSSDNKNVIFLTKPEVRKDIRDIQRSVQVESDDDCSVQSEDVVDCRNDYPVKPRKMPRWASGMGRDGNDQEGGNGQRVEYYDAAVVENTMVYLNSIKSSKPELYIAEEERERLDSLRASYQNTLVNSSKRIQGEKHEQEGYFKVMQGLHMRSMLLQNAHVRQNSMTFDVLKTLKRRKSATATIEYEIQKLKSQFTNTKPVRNGNKANSKAKGGANVLEDSLEPGSTSLLRVKMNKGTSKEREVYLYKGQWIDTPMGEGSIENILPKQDKVVIKLPFGIMYCNLKRVLCWGIGGSSTGDGLDLLSDRGLALKWNSLRNNLTMPSAASRAMHQIIDPAKVAEDVAATGLQIPGLENRDVSHSIFRDDEDDLGANNVAEEYDPETDNRLLFSLSQSHMGGAEMVQQFHLPLVYDPKQSRAEIKKQLLAQSTEPAVIVEDPALILAPPQALTYINEQKLNSRNPELHMCPSAFTGSGKNKAGVTGSLVWDASTESMEKALAERGQLVEHLESELYKHLSEVSTTRRRSAKLAVETSALRMAMFTRRVRHRNNLSDHGIDHTNLNAIDNSNGQIDMTVASTLLKENGSKNINEDSQDEEQSKKRARAQEADWLATNNIIEGKRGSSASSSNGSTSNGNGRSDGAVTVENGEKEEEESPPAEVSTTAATASKANGASKAKSKRKRS